MTDGGLVLGASFHCPDEMAAHDRPVTLPAAADEGRVDAAAPPRIAK